MTDSSESSDKHAGKMQKTIGDFFKKGVVGIQRETRKRRNLTANDSEPEMVKKSKSGKNRCAVGDCTTSTSVGDLVTSVDDGLKMCEVKHKETTTGETTSHDCDSYSKTVAETSARTDMELAGDSEDVIPSSQSMLRTTRITLTGAHKKSPARKSPTSKSPARKSPVRCQRPEEIQQIGVSVITDELDTDTVDRLSTARKSPARKSPIRSQHRKEPAAAAADAEGDNVADSPMLTPKRVCKIDIQPQTYETHHPRQLHTPVKLNITPKDANIDRSVSEINAEQCQQKNHRVTASAGSAVGTDSVTKQCVKSGSSEPQSKTDETYESANVTDWSRPGTAVAIRNNATRSPHNISDSEDDFDSELSEMLMEKFVNPRKSRNTTFRPTYGQKGGAKDRTETRDFRKNGNSSRAGTTASSLGFSSTSTAGLSSSLSQNPRLSRSDLLDESTQPYSQTENSDDFRPSGSRSSSRQTSNSDASNGIASLDNIDAEIRSPSAAVTSRPYLRTFSQGYADRDCASSYRYKNMEFYRNAISSVPDGAKIDVMLREWKGNYSKLEIHHGYIQWLFPLPESGLNMLAQPLQTEEAKFLRTDRDAQKRLLSAYRMMLDFYGLELIDVKSGKIQRASNWQERLSNLNRSSHNYLRITRILKCFGEVGLEYLQGPLVEALMREAFVTKTLVNAQRSCRNFWMPAVDDPDYRQKLKSLLPAYY